MSRRSDEVKFRKVGEVDADFDTFSAACLEDMASQQPDQFRWDEEDQTLYMKIGILREAVPDKFPQNISISHGEEPSDAR